MDNILINEEQKEGKALYLPAKCAVYLYSHILFKTEEEKLINETISKQIINRLITVIS